MPRASSSPPCLKVASGCPPPVRESWALTRGLCRAREMPPNKHQHGTAHATAGLLEPGFGLHCCIPPSLTFLLENASKEGTSSSLRGFYWSLQAHGCNGTAWWLPASTLRKIFKNVRNLYSAIWKKQEKHLTCVSGGSGGYLHMKTCIFNSQIDFAFLSDCTKLMIFFLLLKLWVRVSEKYYSLNSRVSSSLMTVSLL